MASRLYEEFIRLRDEKDSLIILGLDPKNEDEAAKCIELSKIKDGVIGHKPNSKFYLTSYGRKDLAQISTNIKGLIGIIDCKSSDGADSNLAELKAFSQLFRYATIAPASSDIEDTIAYAKNNVDIETISMGVMSFPGILRKLHDGGYNIMLTEIERSILAGTAGIVMGATGYVPNSGIEKTLEDYRKKNSGSLRDLTDAELISAIYLRNELFRNVVELMEDKKIITLVPGFGRQGGNLEHFLESGINLNNCMINAGSDIIKAENPVIAIHEMQETFNKYRHYNL